jgi:hypothetical protein
MKAVMWEETGSRGGVKKKQASAARIKRRLEKKELNKKKKGDKNA